MMDRSVSQHYIVLNEPYLRVNINRFSMGKTDYFALMSSPDCQSPPTPDSGQNFQEYAEYSFESRYTNLVELKFPMRSEFDNWY